MKYSASAGPSISIQKLENTSLVTVIATFICTVRSKAFGHKVHLTRSTREQRQYTVTKHNLNNSKSVAQDSSTGCVHATEKGAGWENTACLGVGVGV